MRSSDEDNLEVEIESRAEYNPDNHIRSAARKPRMRSLFIKMDGNNEDERKDIKETLNSL